MDLNDLSAFLAVADAGGLSAAARGQNQSPATLGRRISRLEDQIGQPLFHRSARGYRLTDTGFELRQQSAAFSDGVAHLAQWQSNQDAAETVRVTAGAWTTLRLLRALTQLSLPSPDFRIEFVRSEARLNIGHRQAEIGLRIGRPVEPWLAGRKIGSVSFAVYDRVDKAGQGDRPFVALSDSQTASARWLDARRKADPAATSISLVVNDPRMLLDAVRLGCGQVILPMFIGDDDADLVCVSGPIEALTHEQWIVLHHETRGRPGVRAVANWISGAFG